VQAARGDQRRRRRTRAARPSNPIDAGSGTTYIRKSMSSKKPSTCGTWGRVYTIHVPVAERSARRGGGIARHLIRKRTLAMFGTARSGRGGDVSAVAGRAAGRPGAGGRADLRDGRGPDRGVIWWAPEALPGRALARAWTSTRGSTTGARRCPRWRFFGPDRCKHRGSHVLWRNAPPMAKKAPPHVGNGPVKERPVSTDRPRPAGAGARAARGPRGATPAAWKDRGNGRVSCGSRRCPRRGGRAACRDGRRPCGGAGRPKDRSRRCR